MIEQTDARQVESRLDATEVAVVIPLYGQAHFVTEAVSSVLAQTYPNVTAVVVNDGCPDPDSHRVGQSLHLSHPDRVVYIRRPNGGLSAARNTGIRFARCRFPRLEAIFPLDADNILDPEAIECLKRRLDADPELDWVAPHPWLFGERNHRWRLVDRFTTFRQLFENQADAAALFRSNVFESAGYDEQMRQGYEDWEFYLDRLLAGCRGATEPAAVMRYRSRLNSMLAEASGKHESIRAYMRAKHRVGHLPRSRTRLEHDEMPRYAIVDEFGIVTNVSDPELAPQPGTETSAPPFVVLARRQAVDRLTELCLWRGLLFSATPVDNEDVVVLSYGTRDVFDIDHRERRGGGAAFAVVVPAHAARSALADRRHWSSVLWNARELAVSHPDLPELGAWNDVAIHDALLAVRDLPSLDAERVQSYPRDGHVSDHDFAAWMHEGMQQSTYPLTDDGHLHLGFVLPWLKLGGVEHCVLQVAKQIRATAPDVRIHLALTESGHVLTDVALTSSLFDSVMSVAGLAYERRVALVERWGAAMDVVVNAHSGVAFDALRGRSTAVVRDHQSLEVAYLHVVDMTPSGVTRGWPTVAGELEPMIDRYLVISDHMGAVMRTEGVPNRKLVLGPNAPVVRPIDRAAALRDAHSKSQHVIAGNPMRLLIAGRLDYQKGGRRAAAAISELVARGRDVHVTILGAPTLEAELPEFPEGSSCTWIDATSDLGELSSHFARADVLLLLSRWEGVPLSMLDAMAHGVVVVATDVGAVTEVARDGDNARVISAEADDEEIGRLAAAVIEELIEDPTGQLDMRIRAVETAWSMSWGRTADALVELLSQSRERAT